MYEGMGRALNGCLILLLIVGVLAGVGLAVLLPMLWDWVKPIIHAATTL